MQFISDFWQQGLTHAPELHEKHVNPQMPQVLKIIGFDRRYTKASGTALWDANNRRYLDFLGGYSVFNLGHNNPDVLAALREVLDSSWPNLVQMDLSPLSGELAQNLTSKDPTGRLQYAYFGNSGAEAVECAIKFSRATTRRPRMLSWESGFHGLSLGALSLCGDRSWQEGFGPFMPGFAQVPFGDTVALERELKAGDVAGFIAEPIQGEGGVRSLPRETWAEIQRLCRKYGTLLILDEIQTGMGRTGTFFAFEQLGVEPDMICLSKALTNGTVPCSATLGTKKVFESVFSRLDRCVVHSSTFSENNFAMAAGLAVTRQITEKNLPGRAREMGEKFLAKLRVALADFELVKDIRGHGLMIAVEFGPPKRNLGLKMGWSLIQKANKGLFGQMVTAALMEKHGMLTQVAGHNLNVLKLSPPLTLSEAEMDEFIEALTDVVTECHRFPGGIWDFGVGLAKRAMTS